MPEGDKKPHNGNAEQVSLDKRADILEAMFKHYYELAVDHLTKATSTSNILLIIVGAIITLIGYDKQVCDLIDAAAAIGVTIIAVFGFLWTRKQLERYRHFEYIAHLYQKQLAKIVEMQTELDYRQWAEDAAAKEFRSLFAKKLSIPLLWGALYVFIALIGLGLLVYSVLAPCPETTQIV
jgi:hypothetical protein